MSQTKGLIVKPASAATAGVGRFVLDPDGDGYVSGITNGLQRGFQANDLLESEIPYRPLPVPTAEPMNDLARGPGGGFSDFADMNSTVYPVSSYLSPAGNLMFRFRLGGIAPNSKGYSILVDADGKFGFSGANADPQASTDNPGFEFEILLATNFAVRLYDVNNATGSATQIGTDADLPYSVYAQKAIAFTTNSGDADYFYDFYIPFSRISAYFDGSTALRPLVNTSTPLRMVANTIMAPQSVIKGPISDISGIDGSYSTEAAWTKLISGFVPTAASGTTSSNFPAIRSDAPAVSSPIFATATSVSGTSTEAAGTVISVYKNGVLLGTTTVGSGGAWTLNSVVVALNDRIKATATASGESVSDDSNEVIVQSTCNYSTTPTIGTCVGVKGIDGTVTGATAGTVINIYNFFTPTTVFATVNTGANVSALSPAPANAGEAFIYKYNGNYNNCNAGANNIPDGSYFVTAAQSGKCESKKSALQCFGSVNTASHTLTQAIITQQTSTLSGTITSAVGTKIVLFVDGVYTTQTTVTSGTAWSISGLTLRTGQVVDVYAIASAGACAAVITKTVTDPTATPVVNGPIRTTATSISGTSSEAAGTVITVLRNGASIGTATVTASGTWTLTGVSGLVAGNTITATALAANKTVSETSNSITVITAAAVLAVPTVTLIGGVSYKEGGTSVTGTGPASATINVYIDGYLLRTVTSNTSGNWTVTGLSASQYELYTGGRITATSGVIGNNESAHSASETVECVPPVLKTSTVVNNPICEGSQAEFRIANSEDGVIYTLRNGTTERGASVLGTGGTISFQTWELTANETFTVAAQKVSGGTCSPTTFSGGTITVNPKPDDRKPVVAPSAVTDGASATIQVQDSQNGYLYQLQKNGSNIGSTVTGTGGTISLTTDPIIEETTYKVQVTDVTRSTNCTVELTQSARISVNPLPVELQYFTAKAHTNSNLLNWATASEKNNDFFEIQKSFNGREFITIGKVKGAGNAATVKQYSFEDRQLNAGLVYYRLKQVDHDGSFEYSKLVVLERNATNQLAILFPNPANKDCSLKLQSNQAETASIAIYETNGRLVTEKTAQLQNGENTIPLEINTLQSGFYVVKITANKLQTTLKLQKISE